MTNWLEPKITLKEYNNPCSLTNLYKRLNIALHTLKEESVAKLLNKGREKN